MITLISPRLRRVVGIAGASAIVAFGLLAVDRGHIAAEPRGVVEIGELRLVRLAQPGEALLPEASGSRQGGS